MKYGVSQIHFKRPVQFVKYLKYCLKKSDNNTVDFSKIKRLDFKDNTELSIMCALPRVSQQKGKVLLEKFIPKIALLDKEKNVLSKEDLKTQMLSIKGVGKKFYQNLENHYRLQIIFLQILVHQSERQHFPESSDLLRLGAPVQP